MEETKEMLLAMKIEDWLGNENLMKTKWKYFYSIDWNETASQIQHWY